MNIEEEKSGIMLQCNRSGQIVRVIRDDLGITAGCSPAGTFFELVDSASREKSQEFFRAVQAGHASFGWELNVPSNSQLVGLLFLGGLTDETLVICGSPSRAGLNQLVDAMVKIQNEQLNALRATLKDEQLRAAEHGQREQAMLDDFTRLNNELVNLQREVARRNVELANANTQLQSLATTDGLTGLKNHRAFQDALGSEWVRAARYGTSLSLIMLDVDRFKQFNDEFGHPAGDRVLNQVAQIIAGECRSDSFVARYGGEEFAVILPNCGADAVDGIAERLRRAVEKGPWDLRPMTASLGTSTMVASMPNRAELVARADAAMYRAKVNGRNRVCGDSDIADETLVLAT